MGYMPTLAVVIPAKNEEICLPFLLNALRKQRRQPDEVIVADGGSTDKTREIAKRFGARVVKGGLPGVGRNRGAKAATSEVLLFLDADVTILSAQFLGDALEEFCARNLDIASVNVSLPEGGVADRAYHNAYNVYARMWGSVRPHAHGSCMVVKRTLHEQIGGFDEAARLCEDHEYAQRAAKEGKFGFLDSVKIGLNTRRLDHEGRLKLLLKYMLAEFHLLVIGPIHHDAFSYHFDYDEKLLTKVKEKVKNWQL